MQFVLATLDKVIYIVLAYRTKGGVAQLVRVSACHAEGREFDSRHSRH